MRKHRIILFLWVCGMMMVMPNEVQAQWRVGASGGATYNWYHIDTQYQTDYRYEGAWGWNAAVFTQYNFRDWIGLRAEVEAAERNYRFYRSGIYAGTNYTYHNTYVQVPVMAQFSFGAVNTPEWPKGGKVRGFLNVGVYAGYWAASRQKGTFYDSMSGITSKVNDPYIYQSEKDQRADFGLVGGIGIEYQPVAHWAIHAEGRCYYGFISTVKQYMLIKDYRYNTTIGMNIGFAYIF